MKSQNAVAVAATSIELKYGNINIKGAYNAPKLNEAARAVLQALALVKYYDPKKGTEVNAFGHNVGSGSAIIDQVVMTTLGQCSLEQVRQALLSTSAWREKAKSKYPLSHLKAGQVKGGQVTHNKMRDHLRWYSNREFLTRLARVGVTGEKASQVMALLGPQGRLLSSRVKNLSNCFV
jgi:hypothetical protein